MRAKTKIYFEPDTFSLRLFLDFAIGTKSIPQINMADATINEDWNEDDNKRYRGKIDRVSVSRTEYYEAHYFIDHYLETHKYAKSDANRKRVGDAMDLYPGRAPIQRDELTDWLNNRFAKKK